MNWHLKMGFLEIDGGHPVPLTDRQEHRLNGHHLEGRRERSMTGRHDLEVFHTMNRWLEKAGEVSGASSTAPMAMKPKVTSSRAAPVIEMGLEEGIGMGIMEEEEC